MNIWHDIAPARVTASSFDAVVEMPRGCHLKYEFDKETGLLMLDRVLYTATHYPANYGFIPRTLAEDEDPLDVLILSDEEFSPLSLIPCRPIGVVSMTDGGELDEKIIAIAKGDPTYCGYRSIHELPAHIHHEMLHFFSIYKQLEGKETHADRIGGPSEAISIVEASIARYEASIYAGGLGCS